MNLLMHIDTKAEELHDEVMEILNSDGVERVGRKI